MLAWFLIMVGGCIYFLIEVSKTHKVVVCHSKDCEHNRKGSCILPKVVIYDNGAKGMCLYHSKPMLKRVEQVLFEGIDIGRGTLHKSCIEDDSAIKSPEGFEQWMKRHLK